MNPQAVEGDYRYITPGYLESLRVPLLEGAWPRSGDPDLAIVVDEALSERLWPEGNALGQTLSAQPLGDRRDDFIVIGVVSSTRHETLRQAGRPTVYFTSPRYTLPYMTTIVRGQVSAASLFSQARQLGYEAHPDFLVAEARDLDEIVSSANALTRWLVTMVSVLALGASIISAVGLYAVVGQFVTAYKPYLGIRRALGARPLHLVALVTRRVSLIVATGCVLGVGLAYVAATFLRSELVGVGPSDPLTWATAFLLLVLLSAVAIAFPVRGAIAVSPLDVLRSE